MLIGCWLASMGLFLFFGVLFLVVNLLPGSQTVGQALVGLCTESAFSGREREKEEIGVVNHLEGVRPPEVELRLLYILYQSFGSCRPQIKAILNHSTGYWSRG